MFKNTNRKSLMKLRSKGFTLIELIVVVGIIGILVGIASPRFTGFIEKADTARIQNDTVVLENEIGLNDILEKDNLNSWAVGTVGEGSLMGMIKNGSLYDRTGKVSSLVDSTGSYHIVPKEVIDKINTSLEGQFYYNGRDKVYYSKVKAKGVIPYTEKEIDDFIEKETDVIPVASYEDLMAIGSGGEHMFAKGTKWETKRTTNISDERFYMQVKDIDLAGKHYKPIGSDAWSFSGNYNGGNYTIKNLTVNSPNEPFKGMFGKVLGSTIMDLTLENVNVVGEYNTGGLVGYVDSNKDSLVSNVHITGKVSSGDNTGGLIGYSGVASVIDSSANIDVIGSICGGSQGRIGGLIGSGSAKSTHKIDNVHVTGSIYSQKCHSHIGGVIGTYPKEISNSTSNVVITNGGRIGGIAGSIAKEGKVTNSHSDITVNTNGYSVGGIVGENFGSVSKTSSDVNIVSESSNIGGIVGENFGTVDNSYSLGTLSGSHDVGGIVGDNRNGSLIKNTYAIVDVKLSTNSDGTLGGIIGKRTSDSKSTISSYFNAELSGVNKGVGSSSDTGIKSMSVEEMKKKESYVGWDFNNIWEMIDNNSFPTLRSFDY